MNRILVIAFVAFLVSGCVGSDFAKSVEGSWQMSSGVVDGEEIPLLDSHPITISFEGEEVRGTASCNGYAGTFSLSGSDVQIGNLTMTEMACFPEESMQAEAMFAEAIPRVDTVSVDQQLILSGDGVELVFEVLEPVTESS